LAILGSDLARNGLGFGIQRRRRGVINLPEQAFKPLSGYGCCLGGRDCAHIHVCGCLLGKGTFEESKIADILYQFGEERRSRAIAAAIVKEREVQPFERTGQLARLAVRVLGHRASDPKHPATRTFQALRLYVNDELGELERGLAAAERILKPGGQAAASLAPSAR
jgi:MraW methylase family